jgi:hypothetical protein
MQTMSETTATRNTPFVAYEYATVPVKRSMESMYRDAYQAFGWTLEGHVPVVSPTGAVVLKFKRDRRIKNRPVVSELQRKCEDALTSIENLERSKTSTATGRALAVGIVGSAFLAGSIFSLEAGLIPLFIVLGALGLGGWALGYFTYTGTRAKRTAQVAPLIDREYDVVYETCEQASELLG